jgi:sialidase-1
MPDGKERISFLTCIGLKVTKKFYDHDQVLIKTKTGIDIAKIGEDKAAVICKFYSDDDGKTWDMEMLLDEKTPLYKKYDGYTLVFMNTIGQVHKIPSGPNKGRYIMAAPMYAAASHEKLTDNFRNHPCVGSGIIYSDDQGDTWKMDGMISDYIANEASAVSIENGEAILMIRRLNQMDRLEENPLGLAIDSEKGKRMANKSYDGGKTWSKPFFIDISEVRCHGTLSRVNNRLYFSIPAGLKDKNQIKDNWDDDRIRGTIYFSDDEGITWKHKVVEENYFSYSTIGPLGVNYIITFFSRGGHGRYGIGYRIFTDAWLEK